MFGRQITLCPNLDILTLKLKKRSRDVKTTSTLVVSILLYTLL